MVDFIDDLRDHLSSTWTTANDCYLFAFQVNIIVPTGGMPVGTLEALQAGGVPKLGPVKSSHGVNHYVSGPSLSMARHLVFGLDVPDVFLLIPRAGCDKGFELGRSVKSIAMSHTDIEVPDLVSWSEEMRVLCYNQYSYCSSFIGKIFTCIYHHFICIKQSWYITSATWIFVLFPDAAEVLLHVEYRNVFQGEYFLVQKHRGLSDARDSGADENDILVSSVDYLMRLRDHSLVDAVEPGIVIGIDRAGGLVGQAFWGRCS